MAVCALAVGAHAAPTDLVPRGDVAQDFLVSLSAAGLVPGRTVRDWARGDRLYTRAELAQIVADVRARVGRLDPNRTLGLQALERELAPELRALGVAPRSNERAAGGLVTGLYKGRALFDDDGGGVGASHVVRVAGLLPLGRDGYVAASVGSWRSEWYPNGRRNYPSVESAFVRIDGRALDTTIGVRPLRWGPGYHGPLLIGDSAKSLPLVQVEKSFVLPGALGRRVGRLRFTQFGAQFFEADQPDAPGNARGTRRFLLGRRIETDGESRWTFSVAEAFKATRLPDPWFALVLPFYTYQNAWTRSNRFRLLGFLASDPEPDSFWLNYVATAGASFRADARGTTLYGTLLLDDVKAPQGFGKGDEVPRKLGGQVGVYVPDLGGVGRYAGRLEFSFVDPTTYVTVSRPVNWQRDEVPIGLPSGPNARVWFGRIDARLSSRVDAALDATLRRQASRNQTGLEGNALGVYATYALRSDAFAGLRLDYNRDKNGGEPARSRTRLELNAGIGF